MATTAKRPPSFLDPGRLYSLRGFQEATGVSSTRMREGRLAGIHPDWIMVGRRKFLRGESAIRYVLELAELGAKS